MIVETVKIGSAVIEVYDDSYTGRTKEEIAAIIEDCCRIITESVLQKEKTA